MSHSAVVCTIRARLKGRQYAGIWLPLGNVDGQGTRLGALLDGCLSSCVKWSDDMKTLVQYRSHDLIAERGRPDEIELVCRHGQRGASSLGYDEHLKRKYRRIDSDTDAMTAGVLFHLPRAAETGFAVFHRPFNRGVKTLLVEHINDCLLPKGLAVEVSVCTNEELLDQALRSEDGIKDLALVHWGRPDDPLMPDDLVSRGELGRLELSIKPKRGRRVLPGRVRRYMQTHRIADIIDMPGFPADDVAVTVVMNGRQQRVLLSGDTVPVRIEIGPKLVRGEPDPESLFEELRRALSVVT